MTTIVQLTKNRYVEKETGYLICENATLGSTGVQEYLAGELNLEGIPPMTKVKVYRPEEEVFKQESLASLENKAFTVLHPDENVTSLNDSILRKGSVYNIRREGNTIVGDIQVTDQDTINKLKYVKCLSLGYDLRLEPMEGETNAFIARDIKYNHLALVPKGRSKVAQINDAIVDNFNKGENYMSLFKKHTTAVVDEDKLDKDQEQEKDVVDSCKDEDNGDCNAHDTCNETESSVNDEESKTEKEKVEERDKKEGAEEDTVTKEIEKRVAKGDYTKKDLEKLLEKLEKGETKEIEKDYEERKNEEKKAKDGGEMTLNEIDAIKDADIRRIALEEYKAKAMAQKGIPYGDDTNAFTKPVTKTENKALDAETERKNYYKHTLNPHENPNFKKEAIRLSNVVDLF